MLLHSSTTSLTRDELARALGMSRAAVDALIGGADDKVSLRDVERALESALLRLYHAEVAKSVAPAPQTQRGEQADESITIDSAAERGDAPPTATPSAESPVITRTFEEFDLEANERIDPRLAPRYVPRRAIGGVFNKTKFTIMQLSSTGLRIRHEEPLLPGEEARLTFALLQPAQSIIIRARVVWTRIASRGGTSFCISGLRVTENQERLRRALELLRESRMVESERTTGKRPATSREIPKEVDGLSDDEVASILRIARRLADDPVEANRWYSRARYSGADPQVREALPATTRDRDRILSVWEALERKVDLKKVAGVLAWTRNARAAS